MAKNRDKPVVLSRIYTRTGDDGTTALGDGSRTRKTDARLAAYADVEEANAAIGAAIALGGLPENVVTLLTRVQNDLFDVGADLCAPVVPDPQYPPLRVEPSYIERLEAACDEHNETLQPLRSFILPGGSEAAARVHVARASVRRAERAMTALAAEEPVNPAALAYINRLSDYLFQLSRAVNAAGAGDVLWVPGQNR